MLKQVKRADAIHQFVIDKVKELRIANGLSQAALASKLELSSSFVGQIEDPKHIAKYNLSHINRLAVIFKCSPKDFLPQSPF